MAEIILAFLVGFSVGVIFLSWVETRRDKRKTVFSQDQSYYDTLNFK